MATTAYQFPQFTQKALTGAVNLSTDTLKVLCFSSYTFSNTHATLVDVLAAGTELSTGNGYTAGGIAMSGVSITTSGQVTSLTVTSPTITVPTSGSLSFAFLVFADTQGGSTATRYPIAYWDMGGTVTYNDTSGGSETVTIPITGALATWTAA